MSLKPLLLSLLLTTSLIGTIFADYESGLIAYQEDDYDSALIEWEEAAEQGDPKAQNSLGGMYRTGEEGVPRDYKQAFNWFKKAANQGNAQAQYDLGLMYWNGNGVPIDDKQAFNWYQKAAEQGHSDAQFYLGYMYFFGDGVSQDYKQAFNWYQKAANQGNALAQLDLGLMYANGDGAAPQDYKQAFNWYQKAAEQGNDWAQYYLGLMYANGDGAPQDYKQAFNWFQKAAEQELSDAQYYLGVMYRQGEGVPKDMHKANYFINKANESVSGISTIPERFAIAIYKDCDKENPRTYSAPRCERLLELVKEDILKCKKNIGSVKGYKDFKLCSTLMEAASFKVVTEGVFILGGQASVVGNHDQIEKDGSRALLEGTVTKSIFDIEKNLRHNALTEYWERLPINQVIVEIGDYDADKLNKLVKALKKKYKLYEPPLSLLVEEFVLYGLHKKDVYPFGHFGSDAILHHVNFSQGLFDLPLGKGTHQYSWLFEDGQIELTVRLEPDIRNTNEISQYVPADISYDSMPIIQIKYYNLKSAKANIDRRDRYRKSFTDFYNKLMTKDISDDI